MRKIIQAISLTFALLFCQSLLAQNPSATFRSQTNVVLVPTLVMNKSGNLVYGLSQKDFIVTDDGVEQEVRLDDAPEVQPISLVVAIQVGRSAPLQFKGKDDPTLPESDIEDCRVKRHPCPTAISGIGTMLQSFIGESAGKVAVVTFDSQVHLFQDFTSPTDTLSRRLKLLSPGDGGAAILDAVRYSLQLLDKRPRNERHVLLLISEQRDHGSRIATVAGLAQQLTLSNTVVYSAAFSPSRTEFLRDLKGDNPAAGMTDLLAPIRLSVQTMRKNVARTVAQMSGGEYRTFKNKRTFDATLGTAANHARNSYQLSFQPKSPKPGPHVITVRLRKPPANTIVVARSAYWAVKTGE